MEKNEKLFSHFREAASSDLQRDDKIQECKNIMEELLKKREVLHDLLTQKATQEEPESFLPPDINGFSLYRDPEKQFSMHLFIWAPYVPYPIHDHGSWGVVGCYQGRIEETKWSWQGKIDDRTVDLKPLEPQVLEQGETTYVYPLSEGPHSMRPLDEKMAMSIHVYGKPERKGMLRYFHRSFDRTEGYTFHYAKPLYVTRRLLALEALSEVDSSAGKEVKEQVLKTSSNKVLVKMLESF